MNKSCAEVVRTTVINYETLELTTHTCVQNKWTKTNDVRYVVLIWGVNTMQHEYLISEVARGWDNGAYSCRGRSSRLPSTPACGSASCTSACGCWSWLGIYDLECWRLMLLIRKFMKAWRLASWSLRRRFLMLIWDPNFDFEFYEVCASWRFVRSW